MKTRAFRKPLSILLTLAMVFGMFAMLGAVAGAEISGSTLIARYFSTSSYTYDAVSHADGVVLEGGPTPVFNHLLGMTYFDKAYVRLTKENIFADVTRDSGLTFAFNYRPGFEENHRHIVSIGQNNYGDGTAHHFFISGATAHNSSGNLPMVEWVSGSGETIAAYPAGVPQQEGREYNIVVVVDKDAGIVFYIDGEKKTTVYAGSDLNGQIGNVRSFLDEVHTYNKNYVGCSRWTGDIKIEGYLSDLRFYKAAASETEAYDLITDMATPPQADQSALIGRYFSTDNVWYDAVKGANGLQWQAGDFPVYNRSNGWTTFNDNMYVRLENEDLFANVTRDTGLTFTYDYIPKFSANDRFRHVVSIGQREYGDGQSNHLFISGAHTQHTDNMIQVTWVNGNGAELVNAYADGVPQVEGKEYSVVVSIDKDQGVIFYVDGVKRNTVYVNSSLNDQLGNIRSFLDEVHNYKNNYFGCSRWTNDNKIKGLLHDVCIYKDTYTEDEIRAMLAARAAVPIDLNVPNFNATAYHYADVANNGYANLVYASPATDNDGGMGIRGADGSDNYKNIGGANLKLFTPLQAVLVYDGARETYVPIQLESIFANQSNISKSRIRYATSGSDLFTLKNDWQGYMDSAWKTWAVNYTGTSFSSSSGTESDYLVENKNTTRFFWNAQKYAGTGNTEAYFDHVQNVRYDFKVYYDLSVGGTDDDYKSITTNSDYYILNYRPVYDVLSAAGAKYNNEMVGKKWMYTEASYAQAMLAMRHLTMSSPALYDYDARGAGFATRFCAGAIRQAAADYAAINLVKKTGTVTFNYEDGTEFRTVTADYGDTFTVPAVPAKASDAQYDYIDPVWTPSLTAGSTPVMSDDYKDQVYTASYTPSLRSYEITWNYITADGAQSTSTTVDYGQTPTAPAEATGNYQTAERVYTFSNWSPAVTAVIGTAAYTAQYTDVARTYEVKFYDLNGDLIGETQNIAYGAAATAPDLPTKAPDDDNHYTVTWDTAFNSITDDTDVHATAAPVAHTYGGAPVWGDWTDANTVTATFTCDGCDNTVTPEVTVASAATAATCTADAFTVYTAKVTMDGTEYTNPTTKTVVDENTRTGHIYNAPAAADWNWTKSGDTYTATVTVTCKEGDDTRVLTATVSGPAIVEAQHLTPGSKTFTATATINGQTFTAEKADEIPAPGHSWTYHEAAPSSVCTATGAVAYWSCSGCDELRAANQTDVITSIDDNTYGPHDYGPLIAAQAPTCVDDGTVAHYHCSVCEKDFDESKAEIDSIVAVATGSHSYTVLQYDETNHWYKCANCDTTDGAAAHSGGTATCTEKAVCTVCGQSYGEMLEHSYTVPQYDETEHWSKCANCDAITAKEAHTGGTATCTAQAVCTVCGQSYGEMLDHSYTVPQYDETDHWSKCANCDAITAKEAHTGGTATCTVQAVCTVCGQSYGEMLDHSYTVPQYDETDHWTKCANCDAITAKEAHTGGTATCTALARCEVCDQEYDDYDYDNHSTTETVLKNAVAAGYTHTGYTGDTYCKACDHQVGTGEEIAKLDINNNAIYAAAIEVAAEAEADPDKYDATAVAELNEKLDELAGALAIDNNEEAVTAALGQLETIVESMGANILFTLTVDADNGTDPVEKKGTAGSSVDLGTPEKEGYAFKEWTVTAGTIEGTTYTFTDSDATATAVYTVKTGDATTAAQAILDNPGAYDDAYVAALSGKINELNALDATDPANNAAVKTIVDAINALLEDADANRVYTVTFTVDGETVKTEKVKTGNDATPPTVDEYVVEENIHGKFSGWTGDYTNVTADVDVSGTYAFTAHVWVDGEVTKAATCIAAGTQDQSCVCGATNVKTLAIDTTAHEYGEWTDEIPAGCTAEGTLGYYHCDVCGKNFDAAHNELDSLVIGKLEHTLHHVEAKAAGCPLHAARSMAPRKGQAIAVTGNDGNIEYWYCETCDFYYADADAATTLTEDQIVIPAAHNLTHHDGVEKTHTTDGAKEYWYCDICEMYFFTEDASEPLTEEQFSAQVVIPADTVHTPGTPVKKNEVKATCQAGGQYDLVTYCVEGGEELSRETVYTDPDPDAHTPGAAVKEHETPATCTEAGSYDLVTYCTLCGDPVATETVTVPAKGHTWGDWTIVRPATEDDPGEAKRVCSACGEEETRSAEEVEPVDKIVKFVNIAKMYYVIDLGDDSTYTIYNSSTVSWYSNEPLTFYVGTFSGFGFSDVIVYANGQELVPDENGAYTLPNNGDTVIVTVSGAVQDDSAPNGKLSFWELLIRFFRKIVAFFSGAFGKAG